MLSVTYNVCICFLPAYTVTLLTGCGEVRNETGTHAFVILFKRVRENRVVVCDVGSNGVNEIQRSILPFIFPYIFFEYKKMFMCLQEYISITTF